MKKYVLVSLVFMTLLIYVYFQVTVEFDKFTTASMQNYEVDEVYLLSDDIEVKSLFTVHLEEVEICDQDGSVIKNDDLPFEWLVWLDDEMLLRAGHADLRLLKYVPFDYRVKNETLRFVKSIKRVEARQESQDYYLKVTYRYLGLKRHKILFFVTM